MLYVYAGCSWNRRLSLASLPLSLDEQTIFESCLRRAFRYKRAAGKAPVFIDNAMQTLHGLRLEAFDEHMLRRVYFPGEIAAYLIGAKMPSAGCCSSPSGLSCPFWLLHQHFASDPGKPKSRSQSGLCSEVLHDGPKSKELVLLQDGMAAVEIASCKHITEVFRDWCRAVAVQRPQYFGFGSFWVSALRETQEIGRQTWD